MHKTTIITIATAGLLSGTAVLALGGGPATASTSYHRTQYVAHDLPGELAMADIADPRDGSPGIGDVLAFTQRLTQHGHPVGRVSNVAIGVDASRHLFQADGTMVLPHGQVEVAGLVPQTSHFVLAVTGGTGRYTGARGTLTFDQRHGLQVLTLAWRR